jgi:hypothetical protein
MIIKINKENLMSNEADLLTFEYDLWRVTRPEENQALLDNIHKGLDSCDIYLSNEQVDYIGKIIFKAATTVLLWDTNHDDDYVIQKIEEGYVASAIDAGFEEGGFVTDGFYEAMAKTAKKDCPEE